MKLKCYKKEYVDVKKIIGKLRKIKHLHICEEIRPGILIDVEYTTLHIFTFTDILDFDSYKEIYNSEFGNKNPNEKLYLEYKNLLAIYKAEKRKRYKNVR